MLNPEIIENTEPILKENAREPKLQLYFDSLNENANSFVNFIINIFIHSE